MRFLLGEAFKNLLQSIRYWLGIDVKVFDQEARTDYSARRHTEGDFEFLNRSARPEISRVRDFLATLINEIRADEERAEIVARLRSGDDMHFRSASFEVLLHGAILRLGYSLEFHPEVPNSPGRPDFRVSSPDGSSFYLEATGTTARDGRDRGAEQRKRVVYDVVNRLSNGNFLLDIRSHGEPGTPPPARRLRDSLERWLGGLNPDEVFERAQVQGYFNGPHFEWEHDGWTLRFTALARPVGRRGQGGRSIGSYSDGVRQIDDWTPIRDRVMEKGRRYGSLDAPLIVAVNSSSFNIENIDVMQALFGQEEIVIRGGETEMRHQPNGVWNGPEGVRYTRISGVWIFGDLNPYNIVSSHHSIYINPHPQYPFPEDLMCLPHHIENDDGQMPFVEGRSLGSIFDLEDGWPEY